MIDVLEKVNLDIKETSYMYVSNTILVTLLPYNVIIQVTLWSFCYACFINSLFILFWIPKIQYVFYTLIVSWRNNNENWELFEERLII